MIKKLLIANRAEIALRVRRAALKLGIEPVMITSDADSAAPHATTNSETLHLPGNTAQETYLSGEKIVQLATEAGCDAVHPGYGFLSENAEFAELVTKTRMKFVGPSAEVIALMGDKIRAKEVAHKANVPLAPSLEINPESIDPKEIEKVVGYPLLLKAQAGGGGRGMRLVREAEKLAQECERASAEALKFFGNGSVFAERYVEYPRHVEVQVFGDGKGKVFHIGTRDCSAQRRHQKLVEEAPAPDLSDAVRNRLHESAVALGEAVHYEGAGTVEFLVKNEEIYFLEMNTRIQVEHPVSEEVYGIDLVQWQLKLASGETLNTEEFEQDPKGHAIEFRVYAEDPANSFAPDLGKIEKLERPRSVALREDIGVTDGSVISPYYDALLTKLIVIGKSRNDALQHARRILRSYKVTGLKTTIPFHLWLTHESTFSETPFDISFIDTHFSEETLKNVPDYESLDSEHRYNDKEPTLHVEHVVIESDKGQELPVEILHRKDGLFRGRVQNGGETGQAFLSQTREGLVSLLQSSF